MSKRRSFWAGRLTAVFMGAFALIGLVTFANTTPAQAQGYYGGMNSYDHVAPGYGGGYHRGYEGGYGRGYYAEPRRAYPARYGYGRPAYYGRSHCRMKRARVWNGYRWVRTVRRVCW